MFDLPWRPLIYRSTLRLLQFLSIDPSSTSTASWLAFNARVLAQARDCRHPLLERVKFLAIVGTNLDEFFMIRVATLQKQLRMHLETVSADGLTTQQQLTTVREQALAMLAEQGRCWEQELRPELARHAITFLDPKDYTDAIST